MEYKKRKIVINPNLKNTWESLHMLRQDYIDYLFKENDTYIYKLLSLPEIERDIFILYCEYQSVRKVATETNKKFKTISVLIKNIKEKLK